MSSPALMIEGIERKAVVDYARSWIGTPYHKGARIRGVGVDCSTILLEVYSHAGFLSPADVAKLEQLTPVNQDWFQHSGEEKYLKLVIRHARHVLTAISYRTLQAKPGCIAVTHHDGGRIRWNHGGIVTEWPRLVHAIYPRVCETNATTDPLWDNREVAIFDPWAKGGDE